MGITGVQLVRFAVGAARAATVAIVLGVGWWAYRGATSLLEPPAPIELPALPPESNIPALPPGLDVVPWTLFGDAGRVEARFVPASSLSIELDRPATGSVLTADASAGETRFLEQTRLMGEPTRKFDDGTRMHALDRGGFHLRVFAREVESQVRVREVRLAMGAGAAGSRLLLRLFPGEPASSAGEPMLPLASGSRLLAAAGEPAREGRLELAQVPASIPDLIDLWRSAGWTATGAGQGRVVLRRGDATVNVWHTTPAQGAVHLMMMRAPAGE